MTRGKKLLLRFVALIAVVGIALILARPGDRGGAYQEKFARWNKLLQETRPGAPVALIDLDALDHNIQQIKERLGTRYQLRLVTKSLPSIPLIDYLMQEAGTRRLMAFSEVMLEELLRAFSDRTDILLGKPLPVEAAGRLLEAHPAAAQVQWLTDSEERTRQYLELAKSRNHPLKINVEIDVGLHRGGARDAVELGRILEVIQESDGLLELTGFMGYDGHVPHVPALPGMQKAAVDRAFQDVLQRYESFVQVARAHQPRAFESPLTFNSGGSLTYALYRQDQATSINDIAVGSAFLTPSSFAALLELGHQPASYLATPVLRKIVPSEVPFLDGASSLLSTWDPNLANGFVLIGGGWTADPVEPPGLTPNFLLESGGGVSSLISNQRLLNGSRRVQLETGDFVFLWPWEGDALVTFETVWVVRGDQLIDRWETFRRGN